MRTLATAPAARRRPPRGAACEEPPRLWGEEAPAAPARAVPEVAAEPRPAELAATAPAAGAPTLEDLISGAWEGLSAAAPVACPVCTGAMAPRWSAGAGVVGGRCADCGTALS